MSKKPKETTEKIREFDPDALLVFNQVTKSKDIQDVYDHTIDAFSDSPDFRWSMDNIKKELSDGWELVSAKDGKYVVAAVFFRLDDSDLLTKNTGIRPEAQGSGFSHQIKEFLEVKAKEVGAKKLLHYCRIDNFRMYSLNESHGYKKSKRPQEDPHIVEWVKEVK